MNKRCTRCNVPHSDHPDSNKNGGVGRLFAWNGDVCPICKDRQQDYETKARPHLIRRKLNQHAKQSTNHRLHDFLTA